MSALVTAGVAGAYAGILLGVHRFVVWQRRRASEGFPALARLDHDFLVEPLSEPLRPLAREALLQPRRLPAELEVPEQDRRWFETLSLVAFRPGDALERLESTPVADAAHLVLREHLRLVHRSNPLSLEWTVFPTKAALRAGLEKFGDVPALYFTRAFASSLVGFNAAAIDDSARAVYFSGEAPFYLRAVLDSRFIEEVRPSLYRQCLESAERQGRGMAPGG